MKLGKEHISFTVSVKKEMLRDAVGRTHAERTGKKVAACAPSCRFRLTERRATTCTMPAVRANGCCDLLLRLPSHPDPLVNVVCDDTAASSDLSALLFPCGFSALLTSFPVLCMPCLVSSSSFFMLPVLQDRVFAGRAGEQRPGRAAHLLLPHPGPQVPRLFPHHPPLQGRFVCVGLGVCIVCGQLLCMPPHRTAFHELVSIAAGQRLVLLLLCRRRLRVCAPPPVTRPTTYFVGLSFAPPLFRCRIFYLCRFDPSRNDVKRVKISGSLLCLTLPGVCRR